jgi:hypothetical protein
MPIEVTLISATWCKRCHVIKPGVEQACKNAGATLTVVDYEELEEDSTLKQQVKALPSLIIDGKIYKPADSEEWREVLAAAAVATAVGATEDTDF